MAAATLCGEADGGYPDCDWDLVRIALRTSDGRPIPPRWDALRLEPHRACEACRRSAAWIAISHRALRKPAAIAMVTIDANGEIGGAPQVPSDRSSRGVLITVQLP
jgi:hypothetical protein